MKSISCGDEDPPEFGLCPECEKLCVTCMESNRHSQSNDFNLCLSCYEDTKSQQISDADDADGDCFHVDEMDCQKDLIEEDNNEDDKDDIQISDTDLINSKEAKTLR